MAIGKYGNVLFGQFLTYRQVLGVQKYQNLTRNPFLRFKVSSDKVLGLKTNFYIFNFWLRQELRKSLCVSVCVCVCLSVCDICEFFIQSA